MKLIHEHLHEKRLKVIKRHLGSRLPDLDLGAGKKPKAEISLDIERESRPNIVADVEHLPIRSGAVNSLICSHVIEHVKDLDRVISELKRILRKGGVAIFFLPDDGSTLWRMLRPFWTIYYEKVVSKQSSPGTHVHSFDYESFRKLVGEFFEPLEVGKINLGMEMYAICKHSLSEN